MVTARAAAKTAQILTRAERLPAECLPHNAGSENESNASMPEASAAVAVREFADSPWRLHQPFEPAGDQPQAIEALIAGLDDGLSFQTLLGVTGSGKTFTMANVIARTGRPALVLAPNKTLAAQLYSEFREFFPENAVEYFVSYYDYYQPEAYVPSRDLFIEKDSSINEHIEQMRLSATKSLLERRDVIIVCTVSAIYGIGDPVDYHSMILHLRCGEKICQREIIRRLTEMQYERNEMDFRRGVYRVRGDVIDVFPAENAENAVRITLFDDEVESLTLFDPLTGHTRQKLGRFTVFPSSHYVTPRATVLKAIEAIKEELRERIEFFQREQKLVECQRIEQRTRFEELRNRLPVAEAERACVAAGATGFDHGGHAWTVLRGGVHADVRRRCRGRSCPRRTAPWP